MKPGFENIFEKYWFSPADFLAVTRGIKPVSRIGAVPMGLQKIIESCKKHGIKYKKVDQAVYSSSEKISLIYISRSEKLIQQAAEAERKGNREKVGELFGYPECCTDFFIKNLFSEKRKDNEGYLIQSIFKNSSKPFPYYTNTIFNDSSKGNTNLIRSETFFQALGRYCLYFIPHHPCSFNCKKSINIGKDIRKIFLQEIPEYCKSLDYWLKKPAIVFDDNHFCAFEGEKKDKTLCYTKIIPELSFLKSEEKELISAGNKIIEENGVLKVFWNEEEKGKINNAILMQFE